MSHLGPNQLVRAGLVESAHGNTAIEYHLIGGGGLCLGRAVQQD
jgi:hypothetical protein